tara:strand:- start:264 stop:482 length:219 start_codon:yes stop_codon:yes gene_type:complete
MGTPYKMKYTNGKKTDTAAFPFKPSPGKQMADQPMDPNKQLDPNATIQEKVDAKIDEKVDEVVNNKAGEGLV